MVDWHYILREQPPVILVRIIEKLEKKYDCKNDIEEVLALVEEEKNSRYFTEMKRYKESEK